MREIWLSICARTAVRAGLALTIAAMSWACFWHRPLFADTAGWYWVVLNLRTIWHAGPQFRLADNLLQIPAVTLLKLTGKFFPSFDVTRLFIQVQHVSYVFHPIVSLLFCAWFLRRKQRAELMVFPLVSLATATQCTIAFVAGIAPLTISVFWPVFFMAMLRDPKSIRENVALVLLSIVLAFTYETVLLFFVLLALQEFYLAYKGNPVLAIAPETAVELAPAPKSTARFSHLVMGALFVFAVAFTAIRIWGPLADFGVGGPGRFWVSIDGFFGNKSSSVYLYTVIVFSMIPLLIVFPRTVKALPYLAAAYAFFAVDSIGRLVQRVHASINADAAAYVSTVISFHGRTAAIPFACALAIACMFCVHLLPKQRLLDPVVRNSFGIFAGFALLVSAAFDLGITAQWREGVRGLQEILDKKPGCVVIEMDDYNKRFGRFGHADYSFAQLSILLQGSRKLHSLVIPASFTHRKPEGKPEEPYCETVQLGFLPERSSEPSPINPRAYFDFSALTTKVKSQ